MQRRYRTVAEMKDREYAEAIAISDNELAGKLTAMGILPGVKIEMVRKAPFGDAFYIKADGIRMALRTSEAALIIVME